MAEATKDVTFKHPMYEIHEHQVQLCQDCYNGIDTVKQYLYPRVNENETDWYNRRQKSVFVNFVERIVTTQAGMIFSKPVTYDDIPDKTVTYLDDLDIAEFAKETAKLGIRDGKAYVLADRATTGGEPYLVHITRDQLINWRKNDEGNITFAVIAETYEDIDGFKIEYKVQYRVMYEDGTVEIWRDLNGAGWEVYDTIIPTHKFLPLYELDVEDVPPLYDIATMNINYYNAYSEKDSIISTATQPSFFTKGLGIKEGEQLAIGVNYTINTDETDADVKWVELDGQSIPQAQDDLTKKEKAMADRALQIQSESQKVQTATQVAIENSESNSRLDDISNDLENTINKAYNALYMMMYSQEAVGKIIIPTDFKSETVDSNVIIGLNNLVIAGNLSKKTMLEALVKHEIIDLDSVDEEIERIDDEFIPLEETNGDSETTTTEG